MAKVGRPKKYDGRMVISHGIPFKLLAKVDALASESKTRTDLINDFISAGLKKRK